MGAHWVFSELQEGVLERRYKRFLADVVLPRRPLSEYREHDGCQRGVSVWLSHNANPKRKLRWTLSWWRRRGACLCALSTGQ